MSEVIVTKQNFASMLNLGKISQAGFKAFNREIHSYAREITEMIIREQQNAQTMEMMQASSEVLGIGTDIGKVLANKTINEGLTQNISFKFSENEHARESKERVGEFWKNENTDLNHFKSDNPSDYLRDKVQKIVKENEELLRAEKIFTDDEFKKIFSDGSGDIPKMLDLDLGAGTAADMEMDVNILDKCSACILKNDGEYIFKDFLILDGNGEAVDPKLINKTTGKFVLNFGLQGDIAKRNTEAMKTITAVANYRDRVRKFSKLRGNGNLLKVLKRCTGLDQLKKEFNEYLQPLRQAMSAKKAVTKVASVGEGAVKISYNVIKGADLKITKDAQKKTIDIAKNEAIGKKKLAQRKKILDKKKEILKAKKAKYEIFEKKASNIRHPIKTVKGRIAERLKATKIGKSIAEAASKSKLLAGYKKIKEGINRVLSIPFKIVGKAMTPIVLIMRQIIITTVLIMLPVIVVLILFMAIAGAMAGGVGTEMAAAVIPLGNESDYKRWQQEYNTLDDNFLNSLEDYLANYATQRNLKGEKIFYGVNGQNNEEGMENDDYVNGMYYRFITDKKNAGRSSNIEDLLCIMAIMMAQSQADYIEESSKVWEWLYDISHSYTFRESPLYACDSGCHKIHYECNDHYHKYTDTDIRYSPFHAYKKSGGEYEIEIAGNYCEVCNQRNKYNVKNTNCVIAALNEPTEEDYWGCVTHSDCFHGEDGNMGDSYSDPYACNNYSTIYICPGHPGDNDETVYCEGPLGCEGYYQCEGHPHYSCDGHDYKCCLGHTDIQMNVEIKFYDELKDIINKYDFGNGDNIANKK